ncbi:MAG TPA: hypothetical protein VG148_02155 [Pyrinomonadaceae bacterium]|nr:hypothetical protein [Pyrinomonadaceae bacterium]
MRTCSTRLYALLLAAYPSEFRREYGREMTLVFAARCRERAGGAAALAGLWREALADLLRAAARERLEGLMKDGRLMMTLRTVALAALAYAFTLFVVAPLFVGNIGRLPAFACYLLDALIFTGLVFNFFFLALTLTRRREGVRAVRASLWITTVVVAVLTAAMMLDTWQPAEINLWVVAAQVLSLLVWHTAHLWWVLRREGPAAPTPAP